MQLGDTWQSVCVFQGSIVLPQMKSIRFDTPKKASCQYYFIRKVKLTYHSVKDRCHHQRASSRIASRDIIWKAIKT